MKDYHYLFILPNCFKVVGLIAMVVAIIELFTLPLNQPIIRIILSVFILGLLLIALAKEKREDEMIIRARYVSVMHAFVLGIFIAIIIPFVSPWMRFAINIGYQEFALVIIDVYIVNFYWFLIQSRYEKHD